MPTSPNQRAVPTGSEDPSTAQDPVAAPRLVAAVGVFLGFFTAGGAIPPSAAGRFFRLVASLSAPVAPAPVARFAATG